MTDKKTNTWYYFNDNDHVVWNNAARQVLYVLMSGVNDFCQLLAIEQLLLHPHRHMLHEYWMLNHVAANNFRNHGAPFTHTHTHIHTHVHTIQNIPVCRTKQKCPHQDWDRLHKISVLQTKNHQEQKHIRQKITCKLIFMHKLCIQYKHPVPFFLVRCNTRILSSTMGITTPTLIPASTLTITQLW